MLQSRLKGDKIKPLNATYERMKHLNIDELIKFHLVFDDLKFEGAYYDVFEAIECEILANFKSLMPRFYFANDTDKAVKKALIKLANGDRKRLSIHKVLPQTLAKKVYAELFSKDFLLIEKSRETQPIKKKHQQLKKVERRYKKDDKVHFNSHFSRFWFKFIEPNLSLLKSGDNKKLMQIIKSEFDEYASLGFEILSGELIAKEFGIDKILFTSFWQRGLEVDILFKFKDKIIIGEAKYKERKVCKNVLNLMLYKCDKLGIKPDIIAIFSKSGFSNELKNLKDDRIRLYGLSEFERLLNG
ncbi:DUF234 domain-containing protein [Campylobacter anatolicus]|nr:DUF234 domain-containing protein [Campylobacter anatolicus]